MAAPNREQFEQFGYIKKDIRVLALWGYLYEGRNMSAIGTRIWPGESAYSAGEKVSLIMRCYGFDSDTYRSNQGIFAKWQLSDGNSVKNYIEKEDVEAFVRKFSDGCSFTGRGEQMKQFITERLEKKIEQIKKEKIREQRAIDEKQAKEAQRRQLEEEIRRRRAAEEARIRREQAEEEARIRKQIAEARKRALEYALDQIRAKNQAENLAKEAAETLKNAVDTSDIMLGIIKYVAAFDIKWEEADSFGIKQFQTSLVKSQYHDFLEACEQMAVSAYGQGDNATAIVVAELACDLPEPGTIEFDIFGQNIGKRDASFHPEVTCLEILRRCYAESGDRIKAEQICRLEEKAIAIARMRVDDVVIDTPLELPDEDFESDCDLEISEEYENELEIPTDDSDAPVIDEITIEEICGTDEVKYDRYSDGMLISINKPEKKVRIGMHVCSNPVRRIDSIEMLANNSEGELQFISVGFNAFSEKNEAAIRFVEGMPACETYKLISNPGNMFAIADGEVYKLKFPNMSAEPVRAYKVQASDYPELNSEGSMVYPPLVLYADDKITIKTTEQGGVFTLNENVAVAYPDINNGNGTNCRYVEGMIIEDRGHNGLIAGMIYEGFITQWYDVKWI